MKQVFKITIEGSLDSDDDGNPDVTFDVDVFGFDVARVKQNLTMGEAFKLFGAVVNTVKGLLGAK